MRQDAGTGVHCSDTTTIVYIYFNVHRDNSSYFLSDTQVCGKVSKARFILHVYLRQRCHGVMMTS